MWVSVTEGPRVFATERGLAGAAANLLGGSSGGLASLGAFALLLPRKLDHKGRLGAAVNQ